MTATARLTPLDASFLAVEAPRAHMHVGWVAIFGPGPDGRRPTFEEIRDHIGSRLGRAPRYRQRLARVPFDIHDPVLVDDERFDLDQHVLHAPGTDLQTIVDAAMSVPLDRDRPLWEMWVADGLPDERLALIGKVHHCLVDGLAAVELGALLLDPDPELQAEQPTAWHPASPPGRLRLAAEATRDRILAGTDLLRAPLSIMRAPERAADTARRAARTVGSALRPAPSSNGLNERGSPLRKLGRLPRATTDLKEIKRAHGVTFNDAVLAACAGALRRHQERKGDPPTQLKVMVPASVRDQGSAGELGNRISFLFVELPCHLEDPVERLEAVHAEMSYHKEAGEIEGGKTALDSLGLLPRAVQHAVANLMSSPRTFNLVISNIPGPQVPMYMRGCELEEAYPIVPLARDHALSIGITTLSTGAFFGLYADAKTLPDVELLCEDIDAEIDELLEQSRAADQAGAGFSTRSSMS